MADKNKITCFYKEDGSPFYYAQTTHYPETKRCPAHWECRYYSPGMTEIAFYQSRNDTLFLNTNYLTNDFKAPYKKRIKESKFEDIFDQLLSRRQRVSEYFRP